MRFECADCGCTVDRGIVVTACEDSACCCLDLPRAPGSPGLAGAPLGEADEGDGGGADRGEGEGESADP